jgi:hypothetical protein
MGTLSSAISLLKETPCVFQFVSGLKATRTLAALDADVPGSVAPATMYPCFALMCTASLWARRASDLFWRSCISPSNAQCGPARIRSEALIKHGQHRLHPTNLSVEVSASLFLHLSFYNTIVNCGGFLLRGITFPLHFGFLLYCLFVS